MIKIRPEKPADIPMISKVLEGAFKRDAEARLADKLRQACPDHLSLVAEDNSAIVGHLMFTAVLIKNDREVIGMGLAPMGVLPARQHQGIGSLLVNTGLELLQEKGCPFVVVLGHPDYYPRFGFQPASRFHIKSQWHGVPDEAFMILIMDDQAMQNISGIATFSNEFNEAL